jgi:hypothetical protein
MSNWTLADIERLQQKGAKVNLPLKNSTVNQPASFALGRMKAGAMNKTESAYAKHLEVQKQFGNVAWYEFEPMNLRLGEKCFYSVDFMVMLKSGALECHEVKGYWTDDALVKIKVAAARFPFRFIAVRLVKGEWEVREF